MSNRPDPRPALRYPLVVNGLDYLLDVVGRLATEPGTAPDARALKYAVLHLQAGTEVLLKARLQQEHWSLVFDEPATATRAKFDSADFTSCTTTAAFTRLTNIVGLDMPQKSIDAVAKLARDRNALMHYGLTQSAGAVEARAADVLNFLLPFLTTHLLPGLDPEHKADAEQTLTVVRAQLRGIEAYVRTRMNDLRAGLAQVADTTVVCPQCAQPALVLAADARPACRFCLKTWQEPDAADKAAAEYSWIVLGQERDDYPAPGSFIQWCTDCPALTRALVMGAVTAASTQRRLCFSCAGDFTDREFTPCLACGALMLSDAEAAKCSACLEYAPDFATIRTATEESAS
ncbi:hypothetical protein J7I98_37865 [Streptomyces sp. ISL-98]|uniref:hypothetical protein n=1 Tax=Streptomyces sp. ISL-98 TaxID=2819192 RepID=UPI001BE7D756|nr:hypothetical protein [Streptomyces sp. ISL-98]MBT2511469.1 hypothetical protein [Streptomyces sp. ISL-98]